MGCGLYGKLPAKRDFIALGVPRGILNAWEPWLQAAVAASRNELGGKWQSVFCAAPIWRFWLGSDICGQSVIGALMPSLDGVGRYFPLTLFAMADREPIPPPELDGQDQWFEAAEALLMSTLDQDSEFDAVSAALDALEPPKTYQPGGSAPGLFFTRDGTAAIAAEGRSFAEIFSAIREHDHAKLYASCSFWWTIGGADYESIALGAKGLPDPALLSMMLTGEFTRFEREAEFDA